eukprot:Gb_13734 [translate_table: standard]
MLEKIGLPQKPSMRGRAWVLDASHCQGCSSQFTFFNRKHHCRRCGGLFCNNCTLQRMVLRGQGDLAVRICDPCKKLEEAARFEARHGHRNRASKGGSRTTVKSENEILEQILGSDGKPQSLTDSDSTGDDHLDHQMVMDDASSSKLHEGDNMSHSRKRDFSNSSFLDSLTHGSDEKDSTTPEELRQQAQEEKKKYSVLKKEGKSEEALLAFKRGKELERRSEALELSLRKSRRKAASGASGSRESRQESLIDSDRKIPLTSKDGPEVESSMVEKKKKSMTQGKEEKDDIASALRELGWSDADLQDADRKPSKMSLEGELSNLVAESHTSKEGITGNRSIGGVDRTQVLVHKRRALALKREGKLVEAKEELKKAKIIEKQLEEQEMIGHEEESDDELAVLIRSLDKEGKVESHPFGGLGEKFAEDSPFNWSQFTTMGDEYDGDIGIGVTDDDINDPEITAALRSVGWTEEADTIENANPPSVYSKAQSMDEIVARRADSRNAANGSKKLGAFALADLDGLQAMDLPKENPKEPLTVPRAIGSSKKGSTQPLVDVTCPTSRDKVALQQDVLSLKREALALKRAGNTAEAMEQLRRAKVLEKELQDLQLQHSEGGIEVDFEASYPLEKRKPKPGQLIKKLYLPEEDVSLMRLDDKDEESIEVTDEDMGDPELAKALKDLGWQESDHAGLPGNNSEKQSLRLAHSPNDFSAIHPIQTSKSKAELRKELLGLKRKALALKREGRIDEADEELRKGKLLEQQLEELETLQQAQVSNRKVVREVIKPSHEQKGLDLWGLPVQLEEDTEEVTEQDMQDPSMVAALRSMGWSDDADELERNYSVTPSRVTYTGESSSQTVLSLEVSGPFSGQSNARGQNLLKSRKNVSTIGRPCDMKDSLLSSNIKTETKENCPSEDIEYPYGKIGLAAATDPPLLCQKNKEDALMQERIPLEAEGQPVNTMDLLTSDTWKFSPLDPGGNLLNHGDGEPVNDALFTSSDSFVGANSAEVCMKVKGAPAATPEQNLQYGKLAQKTKTLLSNSSDILSVTDATECNVNPILGSAFQVQNLPQKVLVHGMKTVMPYASEIGLDASDVDAKSRKSPALVGNLQQEPPVRETKSISPNVGDASVGTDTNGGNANTVASSIASPPQNLQQEILSHKRKAVALKREGKLREAREELRQAKLLERELDLEHNSAGYDGCGSLSSSSVNTVNIPQHTSKTQTNENHVSTTHAVAPSQPAMKFGPDSAIDSISVSTVGSKNNASIKKQQMHKQATGRDRMKLQQESLAHKRRALALRREGKLEESEAEFELAKSLENQMEELAGNNSQAGPSIDSIGNDDGDSLDDILDPQLLSALKGIGWKDNDIFSQMPAKGVQAKKKQPISVLGNVPSILGNDAPQANADTNEGLKKERSQLEEKIRTEKLRALDLKRAGKKDEALDAFRGAKQLEKKLQSLAP